MRRFLGLTLILALAASVFAAACGGDSKTIKTGDGKITVSDKLPDEFPDDFPIYKADFKGSYFGESEGVKGLVATWETKDSVDKVRAFFNEEFKDGEWTTTATGDVAGTSAYWTVENKDKSKVGYVFVSGEGGKTTILITVGDNTDGSSGGDSGDEDTPTSDDGDDSDSGSDAVPTAELPDEVKLGDDFPKDEVPLPSGARVTSSSSYSAGGAKTYLLELYSKDSAEDVAGDFKSSLEGKGWAESFTSTSDGDIFATYAKGDPSSGNAVIVTISEADVEGYVVVTLSVSFAAQ